MKTEFPDFVSSHTAYLQTLDPMEIKRQLPPLSDEDYKTQPLTADVLNNIISICSKVLEEVNIDAVLIYLAIKNDQRPDAAQIKV